MGDNVRHWRTVLRVPIRREEKVAFLRVMVNAAVLSGTCRGTPSSGGALKSGAQG